jgi:ribulose-phosphate 3-epimerase
MPTIVPAIIPEDIYDLEDKVSLVKGAASEIHMDVCDGIFVPSVSWPRRGDKIFEEMISGEDRGLPSWEEVDYEIDLMTAHPDRDIFDWINAGASRILIHIESFLNKDGSSENSNLPALDEMLTRLKTEYDFDPDSTDDFFQVGLVVGLDTALDIIKPYANRVNYLQAMSIAKIGYQGQKFDERIYDRLREMKSRFGSKKISVDGGVNMENAVKLTEAGADRLIVGSAVFENDVPSAAVEELKGLFE